MTLKSQQNSMEDCRASEHESLAVNRAMTSEFGHEELVAITSRPDPRSRCESNSMHQQFSGAYISTPLRQQQPWHDNGDIARRQTMIAQIVHFMKVRNPLEGREWHAKLPQFVKRLESELYHTAHCLADYMAPETLQARLHIIARRLRERQIQRHGPLIMNPTLPGGSRPDGEHNVVGEAVLLAPRVNDTGQVPLSAPADNCKRTAIVACDEWKEESSRDARVHQSRKLLILLRHASECHSPPGNCHFVQNCDQLRKLWGPLGYL